MSKKTDSLRRDIGIDTAWIVSTIILYSGIQLSGLHLPKNEGDDALRQFFINVFSPFEYWYFNFSIFLMIIISISLIISRDIERRKKRAQNNSSF